MLNLHAPEGATWEFMVLFGVVLIGPILVERFRLPGIIGLLIGGFAIGPHGLGIIAAGNTTVPDVGQLGLLYLMFVAGVELDLSLLRLHKRGVVIFSLLTFSIPMILGSGVGFLLGWSTAAALLLGSLLASHTLLTYPIIRNAGLASTPAAATAVGATVVTDTVALIVLAAVAGSVTGTGSTAEIMVQILVGLILLSLSTLWLMPKVARLALRRLGTQKTVRYLIALFAFLVAATLSEIFGIEGIVGAFFAGLALNRLVPNGGPLMDRVEFFGSAVFIPIFMVSVGLILNPAVMFEPTTLGLAGLLIVACLGGKAVAAWLTRPLLKVSRDESRMIFSLTSPQAAATLAAVTVGLQIGLFGESVVNASLVVILVSVIISTFVAERAVKRIPPVKVDVRPLGSHVVVAVEDPEQAENALRVASWIASPEGGSATILSESHPHDPGLDARVNDRLDQVAVASDLDAHFDLVHDPSFARGVLNTAASEEASFLLAKIKDEPARAVGSWAEAVTEASAMPAAILKGEIAKVDSVRVLTDDGCEMASALAEAIADRIVAHVDGKVITGEVKGRDASNVPVAGQLMIFPVRSWDLLAGLPDLPDGAALIAVPDYRPPLVRETPKHVDVPLAPNSFPVDGT